MSHLQETGPTSLVHKIVLNGFKHNAKADFVLHNTIHELEPQTLLILDQMHPTYAVGPIKFSTKTLVPKSYLREADCSAWLESKPPNSVLYVSFGSITPTSKEVVHEIARGLLLSRGRRSFALRVRGPGQGQGIGRSVVRPALRAV